MKHNTLYNRLIRSSRWRTLRRHQLEAHPLCAECERLGFTTPARCVHHITPVETGRTEVECIELCFAPNNLQSLCYSCHAEIHKAERSHSKENHKERTNARLQQWIERHNRNNNK